MLSGGIGPPFAIRPDGVCPGQVESPVKNDQRRKGSFVQGGTQEGGVGGWDHDQPIDLARQQGLHALPFAINAFSAGHHREVISSLRRELLEIVRDHCEKTVGDVWDD
jgi:hypothetical protein